MGTVVEKIEYIAGTKEAIKTAIKNKGVAVADTDTFRSYADKIAEIVGGTAAAAYVFANTAAEKSFPELPSTESTAYIFTETAAYEASTLAFSVYESSDLERISKYFDKDKATSGNMVNGLFFKFDQPVRLSKFYAYCGDNGSMYGLTLKGTNNATVQTNKSSELWETLYSAAYEPKDYIELDIDQPYQYYLLSKSSGYLTMYELLFYAIVGGVSCTLSSANMTPEIKVYATDYMRIITQPFYHANEIIGAQTLIMKPYAEGGNLIDYTDNGSAVDLKMYLLTGADKPAIYLLSPDDTFERPEGYTDMTEVADLSLPAHIYKNESGEWVMGGDTPAIGITTDQ